MYHILLSLILISSQNQIKQAEQYLGQQKNHPNKTIQDTQDHSKPDLIAELTKQKELEENALKPDLESLGLDQIDATPKITQVAQNTDQQKNKESGNLVTADNLPDVGGKKDDKQKKDIIPNKSNPIISEAPPLPPKNEVETIANIPKTPTIDKKIAENDQKEAIKEKVSEQDIKKTEEKPDLKNTKLLAIASKPIEKIKELLDKKPKEEVKVDDAKVSEASSDLAVKDQAKIEKRRNKRIAKQVALTELQQKQRSEKLENLRQKYLPKGSGDDVYEGINRYQTISKIIPREKILPKFTNSEVPPPLLNRFRGEENKHHPVIMSNSEKVNFMFKAIAENRIDEFNSLYSLVKDPNIRNSFGDTLLTFAVLMRRHDAVSSLLSKGADPDLTNDLGYTPLNIAIEMVDYESASTLIDMGAKVNLVDDLGRTYLMQSSRIGSLQITDLLISRGVDVNLTDKNGTTALAIAYKHKKDIIAKYLLKYGAKSWIKKGYNDNETSMIEDLFNKWK